MLQALIMFAAEEAEEPSKTLFYICGGLLAAFAVVVAATGITRIGRFPSAGQARAVMALAALLVAATMASAVITA